MREVAVSELTRQPAAAPQRRTRRVRVTFTHNGVSAEIHLLEAEAPQTSAAIWGCLPIRTTILHAMMTGRDALIEIPPESRRFDPRTLPLENGTITPESSANSRTTADCTAPCAMSTAA